MTAKPDLPGLGPRATAPRLAAGADLARLVIDSRTGFILSRIDGRTTLGEICLLSPLPEAETVQILVQLHRDGVIDVPGRERPANRLERRAVPAAPEKPAAAPPRQPTPSATRAAPSAPPRNISRTPTATSRASAPPSPGVQRAGSSPGAVRAPLGGATEPITPRPVTVDAEPRAKNPLPQPRTAPPSTRQPIAPPAPPAPRPLTNSPPSPYGPTPSAVPSVPRTPHPPAPSGPPAAAAPKPSGRPPIEEADLSPEAIARVEEVERRAAADDPFRLLEVPAAVDKRTLRRAYFRLSKEFHPDRYFGRNLGPWRHRLQQIFASLTGAFEELSDETRRAEAIARCKPQ